MHANMANRPDNSPSENRFSPVLRKLVLLLALGSAATESGCQGVGGPNYQKPNPIEVEISKPPASAFDLAVKPPQHSVRDTNLKRLLGLGAVAGAIAYLISRTPPAWNATGEE